MQPSGWGGCLIVYRTEDRTAGTWIRALGTEGLYTPQLCLSVLLPGADLDLLSVQPSHIRDRSFRSSSREASARGLHSRPREGF